jgi:hypothetical protein
LSNSADIRSETPLYALSASDLTLELVQARVDATGVKIDRAIELVREQASTIRDRGDRAEARASITLGAAGVVAGLVVGTFGLLRGYEGIWWAAAGTSLATVIFLVKAAHHSLRALDARQAYELSPEAGLELAKMPPDEAGRFELAARTWECLQLVPVINERLYYAQRGQRNLAFAVIMWFVAGALGFMTNHGLPQITGWIQVTVAAVAVLLSLVLDKADERWTGLWRRVD